MCHRRSVVATWTNGKKTKPTDVRYPQGPSTCWNAPSGVLYGNTDAITAEPLPNGRRAIQIQRACQLNRLHRPSNQHVKLARLCAPLFGVDVIMGKRTIVE